MAVILPDLIICGSIVGTALIIHLFSEILLYSLGGDESQALSQLVVTQAKDYAWLLKLLVNCFAYSCVFVPGYLIYKYVERTNYFEKNDRTCIYKAVCMCFKGFFDNETADRIDLLSKNGGVQTAPLKRTSSHEAVLLLFCFTGLMGAYLTWGVLQEKIITQTYTNFSGETAHFKDSLFLVFCNRLLAFLIAIIWLEFKRPLKRHRTPLYKYSFASFSNIMSAWFQYEALKFINFPTQVLGKSCKIIPVMLMGKVLSKNKYEFYEYLTAILISMGMVFFLTGSANSSKASGVTTITGVFLMVMYMVFDSFTANWQGDLFKSYSMTSIQMMCGVNLFSVIFTAVSLYVQGGFMDSITFATEHPKLIFDVVVLSISAAVGQLFIFYTIATFGPVVFTIIMTVRQAAAILLSCLLYKHSISILGIFGVIVVFFAIFLRVYCNQRRRAQRKRAEAHKPKMAV